MTNKERIKIIFRTVGKIIKKPSLILLVLSDETEFKRHLKKTYGRTQFPTADINQFLIDRKATVNHYTFLDGSSLVTDLALLKSIAQSVPECKYLEIGTWRGESILNVVDAGAHCTSVNLSPEEIIASGFPKYAELQACLIKDTTNIKTVYANSLTFDFSTLNQKFDLIFVDGDHHYEAVKSDTRNVYQLLKNDNSMIVWHDYGYNPEKPRHSVIAGILDGLPAEAHKYLYHVSNTMCAVYTKKNLVADIQHYPTRPDKTFCVMLENKSVED